MRRKKIRSLRCPTCRTLVLASDENFPFCSDRCRLIDLGKWASGGYVISTPVTDPEQLEGHRSKNPSDQQNPDEDQPSHRR
jgi:uncharacterized protein